MFKVLVTAPEIYAHRLSEALRECGITPIERPMIRTDIHAHKDDLKQLWKEAMQYDLLLFTSRHAILAFSQIANGRKSPVPCCAIGADNDCLRKQLGVEPIFVSEEPSPLGIVRELKKRTSKALKLAVLIPDVCGAKEPDTVPEFLSELRRLHHEVCPVKAYATFAAAPDVVKETQRLIAEEHIDAVAITSGVEAEVLHPTEVEVACIGPYTAAYARHLGIKVNFVSSTYHSFGDFAQCLSNYLQTKQREQSR